MTSIHFYLTPNNFHFNIPIINERFQSFILYAVLKIRYVAYTCSASQFRLATFQMVNSHVRLAAPLLDSAAPGSSFPQGKVRVGCGFATVQSTVKVSPSLGRAGEQATWQGLLAVYFSCTYLTFILQVPRRGQSQADPWSSCPR